MTVVFQASDDQPIVSRLEHWRHVVDETFGPALLRPPSRTHVPRQLVVGDVGPSGSASCGSPTRRRRRTAARPRARPG